MLNEIKILSSSLLIENFSSAEEHNEIEIFSRLAVGRRWTYWLISTSFSCFAFQIQFSLFVSVFQLIIFLLFWVVKILRGFFWGIYSKQAEIRSDCGWSERFKVEVIWGWNFLWIDYVVEILYWMLQYSWSSDGLRKSNFRDEVYVAWKLPDLELRALYVFKISLCF